MHILMLVPDRCDSTSFYRSGGVSHNLQSLSGHQIVVAQWEEVVVHWQMLSDFDVIMVQRPYTKLHYDTCQYIKEMNKPLWLDYDDHLFALNPENRAFHVYNSPDTQEYVKNCLKLADIVSVPTENLRQVYGQFNKNVVVIPNAFNDIIFKHPEKINRKNMVLWRGPDAHIYDLMSFGNEINQITREYPDVEFIFLGYYPWFFTETKNKGFAPPVLDIILFYKKIAELGPKLVHVPLHDNPFNRCRSNVCYIEATYAGAMCVVPSWWDVAGALQYSTQEEYYSAMRSVLTGEVDIAAMHKIAWEYIQDCLLLSQVNVLRLNLLKGLV